MPFTILLVLYLLFAIFIYDEFVLLPFIVCSIVGLISGYCDYNRYIKGKFSEPIICLLSICVFIGILILDFNFILLLIFVSLLTLCIGAITSILYNYTHNIDKREKQSRNLNKILDKKNNQLNEEKETMKIALSEARNREFKVGTMMNKSVDAIRYLSDENNKLSAENSLLELKLSNIISQKRIKENDLLLLVKRTSFLEKNLNEITQTRLVLADKEKDLIQKEKALFKEIKKQQTANVNENTNNSTEKLKNELEIIRRDLKENEREKISNSKLLEEARSSLTKHSIEKRELKAKINELLQLKDALVVNTRNLKNEKYSIQSNLDALKVEIDTYKKDNETNTKRIGELNIALNKVRMNENFLNKWLEIETMLIENSFNTNASNSASLINHNYRIGKIDHSLQKDLHKVRCKRNDKIHKANTIINAYDLDKANDCYIKLKKCLEV